LIRVCPKCNAKNALPTEGDPKSFGNPKCAKCGSYLFPKLDQKNKHDTKSTADKQTVEEGFLKGVFWPSIGSVDDANDYLSIYGLLLACWFALGSGLTALLSNSWLDFIFTVFFVIAGIQIKKSNYWPIPFLSTYGFFNFIIVLYVLTQTNGETGGHALFTSAIAAGFSFSLIRAWFLARELKGLNFVDGFKLKFTSNLELQQTVNSYVNWVQKNKIPSLVIIVSFIAFLIFSQANKPKNFNECVIERLNQATNTWVAKRTSGYIHEECRRRFPKINPFLE